MFAKL